LDPNFQTKPDDVDVSKRNVTQQRWRTLWRDNIRIAFLIRRAAAGSPGGAGASRAA
jgi:hypothetical protein